MLYHKNPDGTFREATLNDLIEDKRVSQLLNAACSLEMWRMTVVTEAPEGDIKDYVISHIEVCLSEIEGGIRLVHMSQAPAEVM